ncbi:MAG TPA: DUF58 domain-containing protein [Candidatus Binataceae bacterium]|nr:DUF58 domain-containing protein [Candidatus Binataceae bacterium]
MLEKRAFEPEFMRRLDSLVMGATRARTSRAGRRTIGRVQGTGIEPENFREYTEGDDLRYLDWNALARLDNLTIRTFRAERQVEMTVLIDSSASMSVPASDDKLGLAILLGAGLAYIALGENDPVRLAAFSDLRGGRRLIATRFHRRRESYAEFRPFISALKGRGETQLGGAIDELLSERRPSGIIVVISDFLVNSSDYESALSRLVAARHDVKVLHVMGEHEVTGSYQPGPYRIRDAETGTIREVMFGPAQAEACRTRAKAHADRVREFCRLRGIAYAAAFGANHADEIIRREFPRLGIIA